MFAGGVARGPEKGVTTSLGSSGVTVSFPAIQVTMPMNVDHRLFAPAAARNAPYIVEALRPLMPANAQVLEIASGTGEHGCLFAQTWPSAAFTLSDPQPEARRSIAAWAHHLKLTNVAVCEVDVTHEARWPSAPIDLVVCVNMIHIAPWEACVALMAGASRVLKDNGCLFLYGPFRIAGKHTAPSNAEFDAALRAQDPAWGVRDLQAVASCAAKVGFTQHSAIDMPANNMVVSFKRSP